MATKKDNAEQRAKTERQRRRELRDRIGEKFDQADALAKLVYGTGGEAFRMYSEDIQDRVLWLLSRTVDDARTAFEQLEKVQPTMEVAHG